MKRILLVLAALSAAAAFSGVAAPSAGAWSCTVWQGMPYIAGTNQMTAFETYGIKGGCSATSIDLTALYYYRNGALIGTTTNFGMIFYPFTYVYGTSCGYSGPVSIKVNTYWVGWGPGGVASGYITGKVYAGWCGSGNAPQPAYVYDPLDTVPAGLRGNMTCGPDSCPGGGGEIQQTILKY